MKIGFCLGNGESRIGINLRELSRYGPIYGCNWICNEFPVKKVFAVDPEVVGAIKNTEYAQQLVTQHDVKMVGLPVGWSSGPTSIYWMASFEKVEYIVMLGHDLYGSPSGKINHVYKGTAWGVPTESPAQACGNWIDQLRLVYDTFLGIKFVRAGRESDPIPDPWRVCTNYFQMSHLSTWRALGIDPVLVSGVSKTEES